MDTTVFLTQFWGWLLIIEGAFFLIKGKNALNTVFRSLEETGGAILSGYIALVIGLATVLLHNDWSGGTAFVVTLFGWIAITKGLLRIGFPSAVKVISAPFKASMLLTRVVLALVLVIGICLVVSVA